MLGVRTRPGVAVPEPAATLVTELVADGLVEPGSERIVLTRRGRLLASDVTTRILAALARTRTGACARSRPATTVAVGRLDC